MYKFKNLDLQRFTLSATTSRNPDNIETHDGLAPIGWPQLGTNLVNVGDIVMYDNSGNTGHRAPANQADMATFVGVAESQVPVQSLGDVPQSIRIRRFGIVWMYATNGETYNPYDGVYFNETVSVQTVVKSSNAGARTVFVGFYYPDNQTIMRNPLASKSFTATAVGQLIPVWLTPFYPGGARYPAI